jgi:hypothetical protein
VRLRRRRRRARDGLTWPARGHVVTNDCRRIRIEPAPNAALLNGSGASWVCDWRFTNEPWKYARAKFERLMSSLEKSWIRCDGVIRSLTAWKL